MPYISIHASQKMTDAQRLDIKAELGRIIEVIGKTEKGLMVDFGDGRSMYLAGEGAVKMAFLEMRVLGKIAEESRKSFVARTAEMMSRVLGMDESKLYINILEVNQWGTGGFLKIKEE
ncbi:MAG: phenylpyruvate tautomerase MIF-related protein [Oscillospiraceae bacterium]|nr:phenylpyruvate tautomerase MIF-related protein [Oscillospiraceae bacterium]